MNKQCVHLLLACAMLCIGGLAASQTTTEQPSHQAPGAASAEANRPGNKETCANPVPPSKKPSSPGKAQAPQGAASPVVSVCAPVINVGTSPDAPPAPDTILKPPGPPANPDKQKPAAAEKEKAPAPGETPSSFKFKIKDMLEADLTSSSKPLIWVLITVFVVFAAFIVIAVKAVSRGSKRLPAVLVVSGTALAIWLTYMAIQRVDGREVRPATVDKVYELLVESAAGADSRRDASPAFGQQVQQRLSELQAGMRDQSQRTGAQIEELARQVSRIQSQSVWFPGLLAALFLVALGGIAGWFASRFQPIPSFRLPRPDRYEGTNSTPDASQSNAGTLPLNAIFRLEDVLARLRMSSDKTYRLLESGNKPELDPNEFLNALNTVRRQLEGGLGVDESLARETPIADVKYQFKEDVRFHTFYELNTALGELEDTLSNRYGADCREWRVNALKALAKARRALISVCEAVA